MDIDKAGHEKPEVKLELSGHEASKLFPGARFSSVRPSGVTGTITSRQLLGRYDDFSLCRLDMPQLYVLLQACAGTILKVVYIRRAQ